MLYEKIIYTLIIDNYTPKIKRMYMPIPTIILQNILVIPGWCWSWTRLCGLIIKPSGDSLLLGRNHDGFKIPPTSWSRLSVFLVFFAFHNSIVSVRYRQLLYYYLQTDDGCVVLFSPLGRVWTHYVYRGFKILFSHRRPTKSRYN